MWISLFAHQPNKSNLEVGEFGIINPATAKMMGLAAINFPQFNRINFNGKTPDLDNIDNQDVTAITHHLNPKLKADLLGN